MNYFKLNEKLLKHNLKNKRSITLSLIVAFLITGEIGGPFEEEIFARDLRPRTKQNNELNPVVGGGPTLSTSANGTDLVNIVEANGNGISHNKFIDFSVGSGNSVIFNNNSTKGPVVTKTGGIITHNPNLSKSASAILTEVTGSKASAINGTVEIGGQSADFILANENGITVNGGGFINTNGVTLSTGKPTIVGGNIELDVKKGNVLIEEGGVGTAGNYFNIVAKTIELKGQVAPFDGEKDADITLLAGQNKVTLGGARTITKYETTGHEKETGVKYGIYANHLGSMYGRNIKLISTTEGLGVRHEGIVKSSGDIEINSNGDIEIGGLRSENNIKLNGKGNLKTISGSFKNSNIEYNYSIYADNGVEIDVIGDIVIESVIQAEKSDIKITGKNLTLKAGATAKLLSQKGIIIKVTGVTTVEKLLVPIKKNGKESDAPLVVLKDASGNIIVKDPYTGRTLSSNEIEWISSGIYGNQIDITTGNLNNEGVISTGTNSRDNYIKIQASNNITNKKLISSSGDLSIEARKIVNNADSSIRGAAVKLKALDIQNSGELRQNVGNKGETVDRSNKIEIDIQHGKITNTGVISGYNVEILGNGFVFNEKDGKIEASTEDYPRGMGSITITARTVENKGIIQSYGKGIKNTITINTQNLINAFGAKIIAKKGTLTITTTLGDLLNSGELFADKDVTLTSAKDISNSGKIGGENITITAISGKFENYGKIAAVKKLMVHVNNLINAGTPEEISKYLAAFNTYVQENYEKVQEIIAELEKRAEVTVDPQESTKIEEVLNYYKELERTLSTLKYEVERVGALGILSGNEVDLTSNTDIVNNGIVKSETSVKMTATSGNLTNNGVVEGETDVTIKAGGDIKNTQRLYSAKNLTIEGKSFVSTGSEDLVNKYVELMTKYDEKKLADAEAKIKELENQLQKATTDAEIKRIKTELAAQRAIKIEQAKYKAEIITIKGLGVIESENLTISVTEKLENQGIITAKKDLTFKSTNGDIKNTSNISVGGDANIEGNSFINKAMTIGGKLVGKMTGIFTSESLTVGGDTSIAANKVEIKKDISVGGNTNIALSGTGANFILDSGAKGNLKKDFTVKGGGFTNKGEMVIGGKANIDTISSSRGDTSDGSFSNEGSLDVGGDLSIKSKGFKNTESLNAGGKLDIDATDGKMENTGLLQAKGDSTFKGNGFDNGGQVVLGGKANINAGSGNVENKTFEAKGDIIIETTGDLKNSEKLNTSGKLKIKAKNVNNIGNAEIVNTETDITFSGNMTNEGNIEVTGDIKLTGNGTNSNLTNKGEIKATENGTVDITGDLSNDKTLATGKNFDIKANTVTNKGTVQAGGNLTFDLKKNFTNEKDAKILGGKVEITAKEADNGGGFSNKGTIQSNSELTVDLGTKQIDITFDDQSKMSSMGTMTIKTGGAITNESRLQNLGSLVFTAGKDIINKGMIVSNGDIKLKGQNITNEAGTSIWAARTLVLDAVEKIWNKLKATIESKGDMTLTAATLVNDAGTIKAGGDLNINVNKLENRSVVSGSGYTQKELIKITEKYKFQWVGINKYEVIDIEIPIFESNMVVTDKATISSGKSLTIKGKTSENSNVVNSSGLMSAKDDLIIKGDLRNETHNVTMSVDEYLSKIKVHWRWENRTVGDAWLAGGTIGQGTLKEHLEGIVGRKNALEVLKQIANKNPELKKLMNSAFDSTWMGKDTLEFSKYDGTSKYYYYATNGNAQILAGKNFSHSGGSFINNGGESGSNKTVDVTIGDNNVSGTKANLGVNVKDPNSIKEVDGVKLVHDIPIQTGKVTINGVEIDAGSGGGVSAIAVAGTINPIVFITIPVGENGIFKPATPGPNGKVPYLFETNIDFIDVSKYYGSNYFFQQSGYDPNKTPSVIGDAYYEQQLINDTIREGLGYSGEVSTDQIKVMLDNALGVKEKLGLELGKPLTPDQVNNLEQDIVWYVEMEVQGQIVLVPQVYFGKETRLKMAAADTGEGVGSSVKAGGDVNIDATKVVNSNGNISSGGNVDIKSETDIINNASSGVNGGITAKGDVKLDAKEDIEMIGGSVKSTEGGVDLKAGKNVKVESTLGYDENGNQTVSNTAGVTAKKDINIDAGEKVDIIGGVVESEEGDVNIKAKDVNISDQNIISSGSETTTSGATTTTKSYSKSESSGSGVSGKNVNIKAENDVTIKGSGVAAGDEVNVEAGKNLTITDGQNYYNEKTESQISGDMGDGLLTTGTSKSEKTASTSQGSTVGGLGGVNLKSGGDTTIKGSDLIAGDKGINIKSKGKVEILDGQDTSTTTSESNTYNGVGFTHSTEKTKSTKSKGSSFTTTGDINIESKEGVKSVGTDFKTLKDMTIKSEGDVKFEAGKNTYESEKKSISVGVTSANASAGAGGSSVSAGWDPTKGASTSSVDGDAVQVGKDSMQSGNSKAGKNYMDALTSASTEIGFSMQESKEKSTTWTEGSVKTGGNLTIESKGKTDIGGSDFDVGNDFKIKAKSIETTKYEDVKESESTGVTVGVKVSNTTTSAIADTVNKGMQIAEAAEKGAVNEGLAAAQVAGSATNLIFGDLVGNLTSITGEVGWNNSNSKTTKENITNIKAGGEMKFETTDGDINLKGVNAEANDVTLTAKGGNINIESAKETEESHEKGFNASAGVTASAGVAAIDGANAQLGVTGNAKYSQSDKNNSKNNASTIKAKNKATITSDGDTNVIGSTVEGNDVELNIKGNLNVVTEVDKIDESRIEGWLGADVSAGVASNTVGTGDIGLSAGGGQIFKKGNEMGTQAGITAKKNIDANVGGDLNLKGGSVGSETGDGNLNVGGNVNVEDVKTDLEANGAIVGISGGTKGGGIQGEVGDVIDKEQTAKGTIGLKPGNVTVDGDVNINGNKGEITDVNNNLENSLTTDKDEYKQGGTFSGTGSVVNTKKKGDYDVDQLPPPPKKDEIDGPPPPLNVEPPKKTPDPVPSIPKPPEKEPPKVVVDDNKEKKEEVVVIPPPPKVEEEVVIQLPPPPKKEDVEVIPPPKVEEGPPKPKDPDPVIVNGFKKNPETGKWEKINTDVGVKTTNGFFGNMENLKNFQKGIKDLGTTGSDDKPASQPGYANPAPAPGNAPVSSGSKWEKGPDGKWKTN